MRLIYLLVGCFLFLAKSVHAQDDDTIQFIHGLPMTGEDTSQQIPQPDKPPFDKFVPLSLEQLPSELQQTLANEEQFEDWERQEILYDRNTKLYWIHFRQDSTRRSYAFTEEGSVVRIEEADLPSEK